MYGEMRAYMGLEILVKQVDDLVLYCGVINGLGSGKVGRTLSEIVEKWSPNY